MRYATTKKQRHKPDIPLIIIAFGLTLFGLLLINSASIVISAGKFGNTYYYVWHQIKNGLIFGIAGMLFFMMLDYRTLRKVSVWAFLFTLLLMAAVFFPHIGYGYAGAHRWIKIASFTFQPAEILKLSAIIYFAAWLESCGRKIQDIKEGFLPFVVLVGLSGSFLIMQPDVGTLGVICFGLLAMFFAAGAPLRYVILLIVVGLLAVSLLIVTSGYRLDRFLTFMHPERDPMGSSYQVSQSLLGIGSGGISGLGFGYSRQKFYYLPEPVGDSIFSIAAEEFGFLGSGTIIVLYTALILRILRTAKRAPDDFGKYLATGVAAFWGAQAMINIAAVSGAIPLTGIPLPFISYGGTALMVALCAIGIVLNISKQVETY